MSVPQRAKGDQSEGVVRLSLGGSTEPGFYELDLGGNAGIEMLAVNLDSRESSIEPAGTEDLKVSLQGTGVRVAGEKKVGEGTPRHTLLGSFFALAALLLMIIQAALSTELTRRKQQRSSPIRTGYGVGVKTN